MYCPTCGEFVPRGRTTCAECGTQVALPSTRNGRVLVRFGSEDRRWIPERDLGICPRCGYQGEGLSYFSRGVHTAGLVGITVLTAGAMGIGGLIFYLMRRDHRVCPRCGYSWGRHGELSLPATRLPTPTSGTRIEKAGSAASGSSGSASRFWSILLFVLAAVFLIGAVLEMSLAPLLLSGIAAGGGWMLHRSALEARQARRAALIAELQLPVLKLAAERGGRLTVSDTAAALGWTLPRAEKVLNSLDDGLRVDSEVTDEGVIVYEFRELIHPPERPRELEP